jgi:flavin-dependent dehydrogenase
MTRQKFDIDVVIIGGGPAGSTCGSMLRKYNPDLRVLILERDRFPRDHVGESQLPVVSQLLDEMGCWDKVEAANFPIKIGATYRWGSSKELWDFEFVANSQFEDEARPAKYEGRRRETAFQVDRAVYDQILLDHAAELGCEVRQEARVTEVVRTGDHVDALRLDRGEEIVARFYVDATGGVGLLRRAMGVEVDAPTALRNIALWDYWENAEWAVKIGVGGTRVQVMSLGYGWIWFIPLGPTRTSVGLVTPAAYFKQSGLKPREIYEKALQEEPLISQLLANATCENKFQTTNDWSFVADRLAGENWFLAGDSAGFADPILAAGMTLAQSGAQMVAYTILELVRGEIDPRWLKSIYSDRQIVRIRQHIQFADYWYAGNGQFSDLKDHASQIAKEAGLALDPDQAFRWLGTGGFTNDDPGRAMAAGFDVLTIKQIGQRLSNMPATWAVGKFNSFKLNLEGAEDGFFPVYEGGRVRQEPCFIREGKLLPKTGIYGVVLDAVSRIDLLQGIIERVGTEFARNGYFDRPQKGVVVALHALEGMVAEGWLEASIDPAFPTLGFTTPDDSPFVHANRDNLVPKEGGSLRSRVPIRQCRLRL